jgi:hypothetical protein
MTPELADLLITLAASYCACGAFFAVIYMAFGLRRAVPVPATISWPARILIAPGLMLLWPLLAWTWGLSSRARV